MNYLKGTIMGTGVPVAGGRPALRALLYSSIFSSGFLLVGGMTGTSAFAAACVGAINTTNSTSCPIGSTNGTLTYVTSDPAYAGGDFSLTLQDHNVTGTTDGISLSGVTAGGGPPTTPGNSSIGLNGSSAVVGTNGNGITSTATVGNTKIILNDTSSAKGSNSGIVATSNTANANEGDITVNTGANTSVTGQNGTGIKADAQNVGNVAVNAQGAVTGTNGTGIDAHAFSGTINVTTGANAVAGTAGDGIKAAAGGAVTVGAGGNVTGTGGNGIFAMSDNGKVTVTTTANTTVSGTNGDGIYANATQTGDVEVTANSTTHGSVNGILANAKSGTVKVTTGTAATTGDAGDGIHATASGATTVDAKGNVTGTGGTGIFATSVDGKVTVTTAANTTVSGTTGDGIHADATNTGDVEVTASSTTHGSVNGISADAKSGTVKVTTGTAATTGDTGDGIKATASGAVTVDAHGDVTGTAGKGIEAVAQNGDVNVTTAASTTVKGTGGAGILAVANVSGNTEVTANSAVQGNTFGIDAAANAGTVKVTTGTQAILGNNGDGIHAFGAAGATVDAHADVTGTNAEGIVAQSTNGAVSVTTAVNTTVKGTTTGILARATTTGNVEVSANSIVHGDTTGISANAKAGTVKVTTGTAAVSGGASDGIIAAADGAFATTVETHGDVTGTDGNGILATSGGGDVKVTTNAVDENTTVRGFNGGAIAGIKADTTGAGTVTITNNVIVRGKVTGIDASSGGGAIQITNNFGIENDSTLASDLAIRTSGGPTTIDNNNGIVGRVVTGSVGDVLNNKLLWRTQGTSDFGGGNDAVNNTGLIQAATQSNVAETTTFDNLENLNNNALGIVLTDQAKGDGSNISDLLRTSGNYAGNGGGLGVDAFLGGTGSLADILSIGGNATGATQIFVTDTNGGPGAYNPTGITVVHVDGASDASNFSLGNGPIDKGLFFYDLLFDQPNGNYVLAGIPGRAAFETTAVVSSNQEIWRESADAWSTRQENLRDVIAGSHGVTAVADPSIQGSDAPTTSFWMSALGSWTERDHDQSFSLLNGNFKFDTGYKQDIYGVVGGADFRTAIGDNTSLLFGVMGGYVNSKLDFDKSSTSIDTDGATVGAYAGLWSNGFFANALVKGDFLSVDYNADIADADNEDTTNADSIGVRGDLGYRLGNAGLFLEPMLSLDAIWAKVDKFSIGGSDIDAGTNESYRGGAGLRGGFGDETYRVSATARIWDVFSTKNEVDIKSAGPVLGISDDDLEGVYGDVSGQVDVNLTSNATVYVKGGVLFSGDVTKPNASAGFAVNW